MRSGQRLAAPVGRREPQNGSAARTAGGGGGGAHISETTIFILSYGGLHTLGVNNVTLHACNVILFT